MENADSAQTCPSLLIKIRDPNDVESWRTFVDIYAPLIYRYCRSKGLQDADAADVGQEVLAGVAHAIRRFEYRPERGRFRDWLGAVTRNKLADHVQIRDRPGRGTGGPDSDRTFDFLQTTEADPQWATEFSAHILHVALERIRPRFEPTTWRAFETVWARGVSPLDVAREMEMPIDRVYLAKSRVLRRLREEVTLLAEDSPLFVPLD